MIKNNRKYLMVWAGSWPGYKYIGSFKQLKRVDRELIKDEIGMLFTMRGDRFERIGLNGKIKC